MRLIALNVQLANHKKEISTMFHLKINTWVKWKDIGASEFGSATQLLINLDPKTETYK